MPQGAPETLLLLGVLLPALAAAVLLLLTNRPWRAPPDPGANGWSSALALAAAYVAGRLGLLGLPSFPPFDAEERLLYVVVAALIPSVLHGLLGQAFLLRTALKALLAAAVPWALLRGAGGFEWLLAGGAGIILFWTSLDHLRARLAPALVALCLLLAAAGTGIVLVLSGDLRHGVLAGTLAAGLGVSMVLGWFRPALRLSRGALPLVTTMLVGLWLEGCCFAELTPANAILLAVAPSLAWPAALRALRRLRPWQTALIAAALVLVPIIVAIVCAATSPN